VEGAHDDALVDGDFAVREPELQAVLKALELDTTGFDRFIIAAADTVMSRPNAELVAEVFPGVTVARELGEHDTLLSIDKARRVLGYSPQHSWR